MDRLQLLLKDVTTILNKHAEISKATGGDFNVFRITDIWASERIMCRMLYELLNPNGSHGQGGVYLELFLKSTLGIEQTAKNVKVMREYNACGRFIDLVIELPNLFIPIEVKIWADDQHEQLYDYYNFAKKKCGGENAKVYYLTIDGKEPSTKSKRNLTYDELVLLSWKYDIIKWIDDCIATPQTIQLAPIREVLLQFKQAILKFTGQWEDKVMNEIADVLSASSENIRIAQKLPSALAQCRKNKIAEFYAAVDERLRNEGFERLILGSDCTKAENIHEKKGNLKGMERPNIAYKTNRQVAEFGADIVLQLSIFVNLVVKFVLWRDGKTIEIRGAIDEKKVSEHAMLTEFEDLPYRDNKWCWMDWIWYDKDNGENEDNKINFWEQNENYCKLFEKDTFEEVVEKTVEQTMEMAEKLIGFRETSEMKGQDL